MPARSLLRWRTVLETAPVYAPAATDPVHCVALDAAGRKEDDAPFAAGLRVGKSARVTLQLRDEWGKPQAHLRDTVRFIAWRRADGSLLGGAALQPLLSGGRRRGGRQQRRRGAQRQRGPLRRRLGAG